MDYHGKRVLIRNTVYTVQLLGVKTSSSKLILLYKPDSDSQIYFLFHHCLCGRYELRVVTGYEHFQRPGTALPDFRMHLLGESLTYTPELNVLCSYQKIRGMLKVKYFN